MSDQEANSETSERSAVRRVSLIDSDEAVLDSLRMLFEAHGLEVFPFATAEAFLTPPGPPETDALVLDIGLPGMSGLEMLERWRPRPVHIRIFILSGRIDDSTLSRAFEFGVEAVLRKPTEEVRLIRALALE